SAPAWRATAAFSGELTVEMTCAPPHVAHWIAYNPTAPAPPVTSRVWPVTAPSAKTQRCAVIAGTPKQAPASMSVPGGKGPAGPAGTTNLSAAGPHAGPIWAS